MKKKFSVVSVFAVIFAILFLLGINAIFIVMFLNSLKAGHPGLTMLIPLVAVDLMVVSSAIKLSQRNKKKKVLDAKGKEYTAKFVAYGHIANSNGAPKYFIQYSWIDDQGIKRVGKTDYVYSADQAVAFQLAKTFKIRASEDYSEIVSIPSFPGDGKSSAASFISCGYCGSVYGENETKCPYCGATRQKN